MTGVTSVSNTGSSTQSQGSISEATGMNKDMYLKLFLEQLKNQNPFQTMESSEMMQQMSQLGFMEQVENMKQSVQMMNTLSTNNLFIQGAELLGKDISYLATDGSMETGTPSSVRIKDGTIEYLVGEKYVTASSIQEVNLSKGTDTAV